MGLWLGQQQYQHQPQQQLRKPLQQKQYQSIREQDQYK
jgi:hypothetical protein